MLTPLDPQQWDIFKAGHLLNRAGFGGSPGQILALYKLGFDGAVQKLVRQPDDAGPMPKPGWAEPVDMLAKLAELRGKTDEEMKMARRDFIRQQGENLADLRARWLDQMQRTGDPLREKLALFWHGHFATSSEKVRDAYMLWVQNDLFRRLAPGDVRELTKAISRDPAMMVYLDTRQSKKQKPNENFAREVMELFTLGEGHYSEEDIREAARAFTGYRIDPRTQSFMFVARGGDAGEKKFLGRSGAFGGDDVIDIIFEQPQCARFLAAKVWKFFVYEDPKPELVDALAGILRGNNYQMRPLLEAVFRSGEFYSKRAVRTQIKSPVQWLLQTCNELEVGVPPGRIVLQALKQMGQSLFEPPNVKGWDGGKAWISTSTLLFRYNLAAAMVKGDAGGLGFGGKGKGGMKGGAMPARRNPLGIDFETVAPPELRAKPDELLEQLTMRFFQDPLLPRENQAFTDYLGAKAPDTSDGTMAGLVHLMMSTPEYQLC